MSQPALNVTPNALKVFQEVIQKGEEVAPEDALVRVMIKGRTATEYEYTLGIAEKEEEPSAHMRDSFYDFGDIEDFYITYSISNDVLDDGSNKYVSINSDSNYIEEIKDINKKLKVNP